MHKKRTYLSVPTIHDRSCLVRSGLLGTVLSRSSQIRSEHVIPLCRSNRMNGPCTISCWIHIRYVYPCSDCEIEKGLYSLGQHQHNPDGFAMML
jgi:hypothetical protein